MAKKNLHTSTTCTLVSNSNNNKKLFNKSYYCDLSNQAFPSIPKDLLNPPEYPGFDRFDNGILNLQYEDVEEYGDYQDLTNDPYEQFDSFNSNLEFPALVKTPAVISTSTNTNMETIKTKLIEPFESYDDYQKFTGKYSTSSFVNLGTSLCIVFNISKKLPKQSFIIANSQQFIVINIIGG